MRRYSKGRYRGFHRAKNRRFGPRMEEVEDILMSLKLVSKDWLHFGLGKPWCPYYTIWYCHMPLISELFCGVVTSRPGSNSLWIYCHSNIHVYTAPWYDKMPNRPTLRPTPAGTPNCFSGVIFKRPTQTETVLEFLKLENNQVVCDCLVRLHE